MSEKLDATYQTLVRYIGENGYAPSVRELCKMMGVSSPSTIHTRLERLEAAKLIERVGPRAIRIK